MISSIDFIAGTVLIAMVVVFVLVVVLLAWLIK